ncbi:MAG: hypothetical protein J6K32_02415 [Clostridia bacterium]|nr:hypothetical protein [Clostridia bacterium]
MEQPQTLTVAMLRNCRDFFYPDDLFIDGEYQAENDLEGLLYGVELNGKVLKADPGHTIREINSRIRFIEQHICLAAYVRRYMYKRGFGIPAGKKQEAVGPLTKNSPEEDFLRVLAWLLKSRASFRSKNAEKTARLFLTRGGESGLDREDMLRLAFALSFTPSDLILFLADYHPDARALNWRSEKELACAYTLNWALAQENLKPGDAYTHYQQVVGMLAAQNEDFTPEEGGADPGAGEEINEVLFMISSESDEIFLVRRMSAMKRYYHLPRLEYRLFDQLLSQLGPIISSHLIATESHDQMRERMRDGAHAVYKDGIMLSPALRLLRSEANRIRSDIASFAPESELAQQMRAAADNAPRDPSAVPVPMTASDFEHFFYMGSRVDSLDNNLYVLRKTGSILAPCLLERRLTQQRLTDTAGRSRLPRKWDFETIAFMIVALDSAHREHLITVPGEFGAAPQDNYGDLAAVNLEYTRTAINLTLRELLGHIRPTTGYEYFLLLCSTARDVELEAFRTIYAASYMDEAE